MSSIRDYLNQIQEKYKTDMAREHAYRPALQELLESVDSGLNAVNDAARTEIGMPDFVVLRQPGNVPLGLVEAKDIGNQLSRTEKTPQLKRYMKHGNLMLTNYLEFRWYVNGEKRETVRIARIRKGKIVRIPGAYDDLLDLLRRFVQQTAPNINNASDLAKRLADNAQLIAHFIEKDLRSGDPTKNLLNQMDAFQKTLLPELDKASFADMYAQTLAYGLFASRVNYMGDPVNFSLRGAAEDIPRTNPFLRDLFYHSRFDLGKRLTWMLESLVEVLRHTDMDSILAHFGKRTQQTDPVLHFYETFLRAYNPKLREQRGVYYTPEPVVKYIVRSVDHILKTRFDRPDGLADTDTLILDPAVGTGTFLYFVIEQIKERLAGQRGAWKNYVEKHLLTRLFGFELLMAPYTVAHMKLGLQLLEAGYEFKENERLGIYLTNSLEEGVKEKYKSAFGGFLEQEAKEATAIKRDKPIMVVLGNPPYSGHSANKGDWISKLVKDYYFVDGKPLGERNPKWIQNDYIKFIRFGQWRIERSGSGIVAFVTANSYLDAPTLRGMRQHLLNTFNSIYILNLHGNARTKTSPEGTQDVNVFDIQPGVSIVFLVKEDYIAEKATVYYLDLWGTRTDKYIWLNQHDICNSEWIKIDPVSPYYLFTDTAFDLIDEYKRYRKFDDVMSFNGIGYQTHRDSIAVGYELNELMSQISTYTELTQNIADSVRQSYYRLFDVRYVVFSGEINDRPRPLLLPHVFEDNLLFGLGKQGQAVDARNWQVVMCTDKHTDANLFRRGGVNLFPLYLYPKSDQFDDAGDDISEYPLSDKGRRPNLSKAFVSEMEAKLGLPFKTEGSAFVDGAVPVDWFGPEDVFNYAYALFHSPTYRERYAEFLKIDFPRLPLTSDIDLFAALVRFGAALVSLHLMKSPRLPELMTEFDIKGDNEVASGHPKYIEKHKRVHINKTQYFEGVPQDIWDFHIGGYQVLHKWLKDRRGRKLSYDDLMHYQKIVVALAETVRIMSEIDEAIPQFPIE